MLVILKFTKYFRGMRCNTHERCYIKDLNLQNYPLYVVVLHLFISVIIILHFQNNALKVITPKCNIINSSEKLHNLNTIQIM